MVLFVGSIVGLTASCFGLGATMSNYFGQLVVEKLGHVTSLTGSLVLSLIPICLFGMLMPETYGHRGDFSNNSDSTNERKVSGAELAESGVVSDVPLLLDNDYS